MGLGVLQPSRGNPSVPGTTILVQDANQREEHVVLHPRPSKSPRDPLNWPTWKKDVQLLAISLASGLGGVEASILAAVTAELVKQFHVSLLDAEKLGSYPYFATGAGCLVSAICARMFGKRPVYLVSVAMEFASALWTALATSFGSLLGSRILFGFGLGAFESMVVSSIGDMYFVHQRGRRVAFYSIIALGCTQLSPILGGYVADKYGWRTELWILFAFWAVAALLVIFGCPETTYSRPVQYETDMVASDVGGVYAKGADSPEEETFSSFVKSDPRTQVSEIESGSTERPRSFLSELAPFGKVWSWNPLSPFIRVFTCALYPATWFAFLSSGTLVGWFIALAVDISQIFAYPPFNYKPTQIGYINTFCAPGALVAFIVTHGLADRSARWLARRNNGVFEPEFRLWLMLPSFIIVIPAFALFGWYTGVEAEKREISWVATSFIYGMIIFVVVQTQSVAFAYILDAHRDISIELTIFVVMLRNFFSYGASSFVPLWFMSDGVANTFYGISGLAGGFILFPTLITYIYGKKIRDFIHRHNPMRALHSQVETQMW